MGLLAIGINHRTAPIELREKIAFSPDNMADALLQVVSATSAKEVAILSTCNRTELYCVAEPGAGDELVSWLGRYRQLSLGDMSGSVYEHWDEHCIKHAVRVASGLDSMVLGEPQILGQMKSAFAMAQTYNSAGRELNYFFQHVFSTAKQVRTETDIGSNPVSVAYAATSLAQHIFSDLHKTRVLLIGAGETIELVARHLAEKGVSEMIVANRTLERAHNLAETFKGKAITLEEIPSVLAQADIVVSSTASPLPLLGKGAVEEALKKRKHKPMLMLDLAVPRDIEPQVGKLADVFLYTVDDIQQVVADNQQSRKNAVAAAERIVDAGCKAFLNRQRALSAVDTLTAYRNKINDYRDLELQRALSQLKNGAQAEEVLQRFAHSLVNKVMHEPSVQLKKAATEERHDMLSWAQELLGVGTIVEADGIKDTVYPAKSDIKSDES